MQLPKTLGEKYYVHSIFFFMTSLFIYTFGFYKSFFYSAILDYKSISSESFDGTVYPIEYIPNPILLSYSERKQNFEEIDSKYFIRTPLYNPDIFGRDIDTLQSGNSDYNEVMTQKVTYTVPYLSTYNFDYKEYTGSHPGIDIVVPKGTPVVGIANGLVVDIGYQASGFGNYIVLKHSNVDYSGKQQTLYSIYAHLSKVSTEIGKKIEKGTLIGYVGDSGTATVPHLHFQIDTQYAPFSPFWPFTTEDMKANNVGFFEAVNMGLGKQDAIQYTINGLKFVNDNIVSLLYTSAGESVGEPPVGVVSEEENITETGSDEEEDGGISLPEENTEPSEEIELQVTDSTSLPQLVNKEDILSYDVEVLSSLDLKALDLNDYNELTELGTGENISNEEQEEKANISNQSGDDVPTENINVDETISNEQGLSSEGIPEKVGNLFGDIDNDAPIFEAVKYFVDKGIISGFDDGTFRPKNNITRIEALKVILKTNGILPVQEQKSVFEDIETVSWENTYVNAGIQAGVLSQKNSLFYPQRNFSRAEALKLILILGKADLEGMEEIQSFNDVTQDNWSYKYIQYAMKYHLTSWDEESNFQPDKPITREELVGILYKYVSQ